MAKLSIAIPTHDMINKEYFLRRLLDSLWNQDFQDFEIVVTDNSDDDILKDICDYYGGIKYFRNPVKGMAQNTNEAIRSCTGEIIKILYMDDYMAYNDSLGKIVHNFSGAWLVTGCEHHHQYPDGRGARGLHPHFPITDGIKNNENTIGSPSVIAIKNDNPLLFDESMTWLLDVDYYKRMLETYGQPRILNEICTVIGLHGGQATNLLPDELKMGELDYLQNK